MLFPIMIGYGDYKVSKEMNKILKELDIDINKSVEYLMKKIMEDHNLEIEIKSMLKLKHEVKLSKHHIELYVKSVFKFKYQQY